MRINMYESAVIINSSLEDTQIEAIITKITEAIKNNGGEIREVEKWGRKRLAYPIKKSKIGYYHIMRFDAPVEFIAILDRLYRLEESIIRFMTIKLPKNAVEYFEDKNLQEANLAKVASLGAEVSPIIDIVDVEEPIVVADAEK